MKSIVFVPAHGGTGQTTIVMEVAKAMARKGKRVLVVENDYSYASDCVIDDYLTGKISFEKTFTSICENVSHACWLSTPFYSCVRAGIPRDEITYTIEQYNSNVSALKLELLRLFDVVLWDLRQPYCEPQAIILAKCDVCMLTTASNRFRRRYFSRFLENLLRIMAANNSVTPLGVLLNDIAGDTSPDCSLLCRSKFGALAIDVSRISRASQKDGEIIFSKKINSNFFEDVENLAAKLLK